MSYNPNNPYPQYGVPQYGAAPATPQYGQPAAPQYGAPQYGAPNPTGGMPVSSLPPGLNRFLRQIGDIFANGQMMPTGGDTMISTMKALEEQNGIGNMVIGNGTNRRVYKDGNIVYKIPFKVEGRQDNITELLCTLHLSKANPQILGYLAPTTKFIDQAKFIIAQEYIETFEQIWNRQYAHAPGAGIYALQAIMSNYEQFVTMIQSLSPYFILMDINPFVAPFNTGTSKNWLRVIDYGFFYPIPNGDVPKCQNCGSPLHYVLPVKLNPADIQNLDSPALKDVLIHPHLCTDMYACSSNDPNCPHTEQYARANPTATGGLIEASVIKRYYVAKYGTPELAYENFMKYGYIPQVAAI